EIGIFKKLNREQLAWLRQFDRMQRQKLRKPKSEEQEAREIAQRLEELAAQEDDLTGLLASLASPPTPMPGSSPGSTSSSAPNDPSAPPQNGPAAKGQPSREDLED